MHKVVYKFEDGAAITSYSEALKHKEETGTNWEVTYEEVTLPVEFVQDGCNWEVAGRVRVPVGLKQVDCGNLAARGWFRTDPKKLAKETAAKMDAMRAEEEALKVKEREKAERLAAKEAKAEEQKDVTENE